MLIWFYFERVLPPNFAEENLIKSIISCETVYTL
jgi:hypothetical protein